MTITDPTTAGAGGTELKDGRVVAIAGPVVDVEFPRGHLPEIHTAVEMTLTIEGVDTVVTGEVAQQIGEGRGRAACRTPPAGPPPGPPGRNLGRGLSMPVGDGVLGHVLNVLGEPLDVPKLEN